MSFDLAVWEGPMPPTDAAALTEYQRLMEAWQGDGTPPYADPTPTIRAYVDALLNRWPDITTDAGDDSPWADGPLIGNATGPLFYFSMVWSRVDEAVAVAAMTAEALNLVCFDPQACSLI